MEGRKMLKNFYPYEYVEDVFSIDYNKLYNKGYRGIIFDIDNTLVPHGKSSTEEIDELFKNIHKIGFKTLLLSDNGEKRINKFIENIDTISFFSKSNILVAFIYPSFFGFCALLM